MSNVKTRREVLKTIAASGLAATLGGTLAQAALGQKTSTYAKKYNAFGSHRTLENSYYVGGNLFSFLSESKDTGGAYAMVDSSMPASAGAPPHTHTREDEIFIILEGEVEFTSGGIVTLAKAGDHVFQPRGVTHSFRVLSNGARALTIWTPGGLEAAFKQIAVRAKSLELPSNVPPMTPADLGRIAKIFAKYGYTFAAPTSK
jgi:quercetin dioxygenase-like cupin family protein